jgi:parallel beta-helix repeat protein
MKSIPFALALGAVASLALTPASFAAVSCPDRTLGAISAPSTEAGRACQNAIAKAAASFVKTQVKTTAKCMSAQEPGVCPSAKDVEKAQKSALKARDAVAKSCAGALGDLATSYSTFTSTDDVASCTLSQNNVESRAIAFQVNGTPGVVKANKDRDKCVKTLNSAGVKWSLAALQAINKCLASAIKNGTPGNLTDLCVGHYDAGSFVPPDDVKTKDAIAKAESKLEDGITKSCAVVPTSSLRAINACPEAVTLADIKTCIACNTWDSALSIIAGQYLETGTLVSPGTDALQTAIDAAAPGAKLLIKSGTYQEDVSVTSNVLHSGTQLIGCGGASDERPKLQPPSSGGPYLNGVFAAGIDGLVFQSLEVSGGWQENGIFVTGANGVTFRDLVTDGGDGTKECHHGSNDGGSCTTDADCPPDMDGPGVCVDAVSTYGIFPVESSNVLVELSSAHQIRDAGIYVGSCQGVTMRYNTAIGNVAGMELENSSNGIMHNNYATQNVGGILVFKLPGPTVQRGNDHEISFNVIQRNNVTPNFGIPGTTVAGIPPGTGMVILSTHDSQYHHNIVQNNNSYGFAIIDQQAFDALAGGALGGSYSHTCAAPDVQNKKCNPAAAATDCPITATCNLDQKMFNNEVFGNNVIDDLGIHNGTDPAEGAVGAEDAAYAVIEEDPGGNNNCINGISNTHLQRPLNNTVTTSCGF